MNITDLLRSAQFVVDAQGNKKAVQFDFAIWQAALPLLERLGDLEDQDDIEAVVAAYEEYLGDPGLARPWSDVEAELIDEGLLDG